MCTITVPEVLSVQAGLAYSVLKLKLCQYSRYSTVSDSEEIIQKINQSDKRIEGVMQFEEKFSHFMVNCERYHTIRGVTGTQKVGGTGT